MSTELTHETPRPGDITSGSAARGDRRSSGPEVKLDTFNTEVVQSVAPGTSSSPSHGTPQTDNVRYPDVRKYSDDLPPRVTPLTGLVLPPDLDNSDGYDTPSEINSAEWKSIEELYEG